MLPFSYALRNLFRDKPRMLQTVLGSAMVVLLVMSAAALTGGMRRVLSASGSEYNTILLGAGSEESMMRSEVGEQAAGIAEAAVAGVSEQLGVRGVSTEIHYMTFVKTEAGKEAQSLFRGVTPRALVVHPEVRLIEGHFPRPGQVMVGRLAHRKLKLPRETMQTGAKIIVDDEALTVSGVFAAPGTVMESELWATIGDIRMLSQRDTVSCVVLRMERPEDYEEADLFTKQRLDLELSAIRESDYYGRLSAFFRPLRVMTWMTALLVAAGAVFGGLNTLYAAFAARIREMATLQAIGFGRRALVFSLVQESTLTCLLGALLAASVAVFLMDGITVPFSIGTFTLEVTPQVALAGVLTGLGLGVLGALPPAWRCLRPPLPVALRSD